MGWDGSAGGKQAAAGGLTGPRTAPGKGVDTVRRWGVLGRMDGSGINLSPT